MSATTVPCPRGGQCGSTTHVVGSGAYNECQRAVRGTSGRGVPATPIPASTDVEAHESLDAETLTDYLGKNFITTPYSYQIEDVEQDGAALSVRVHVGWNLTARRDPQFDEDTEFDLHILGDRYQDRPFSAEEIETASGETPPSRHKVCQMIIDYWQNDPEDRY